MICPALIGGFVAWVAVCYDGPVHPSMAFLLTGIISVRSVSQRSRGRMLPWVTTLHNPRRKYHPVISLGGDSELLFCSHPWLKGKHHCHPLWLFCSVFFILLIPTFIFYNVAVVAESQRHLHILPSAWDCDAVAPTAVQWSLSTLLYLFF